MEIDHIGYLTNDIQTAIQQFQKLGYEMGSDIIYDISEETGRNRNIILCFMTNGEYRIELVQPYDENSHVYQTLKRQGDGPYHICYRTNDIQTEIANLRGGGGYYVVREPQAAVAFDGANVAFLYKKGIGMIEIVEEREESH